MRPSMQKIIKKKLQIKENKQFEKIGMKEKKKLVCTP
jgi:hypothetical protein